MCRAGAGAVFRVRPAPIREGVRAATGIGARTACLANLSTRGADFACAPTESCCVRGESNWIRLNWTDSIFNAKSTHNARVLYGVKPVSLFF